LTGASFGNVDNINIFLLRFLRPPPCVTLLSDMEWGNWSNREIARKAEVTHSFVNKLRKTDETNVSGNGFQITPDNPEVTQEKRFTRNGKTYSMNTENIGKSVQRRDGTVIEREDPEEGEKVISGEVSIRKAYEQVKQEEAKAESEPVQPSDNGGASDAEKPKTANVHVANNSGENEWYTPEKHLELARNIMGSIDTDPASCELANRTVKAKTFFSIEDDGLQKQWYGNVWLNPPYANSLVGSFCEKLIDEIKAGRVKQAMLLVNNATETKWFQSSAKTADAICFLRGRVKYISPNGKNNSPLQGQAIIYFGENVSRFCEMFSGSGLVLCTCKKQ